MYLKQVKKEFTKYKDFKVFLLINSAVFKIYYYYNKK